MAQQLDAMADPRTQKVEQTVNSPEFQKTTADVQRQLDEAGKSLEQAGQQMNQQLGKSAGGVLDSISKALERLTNKINNSGKGGEQ